MMQDPSPVWITDLIFARASGGVTREGGVWCVRTPSNPTYWWGNFLLFDQVPCAADTERWKSLFVQHIASRQQLSNHRTFGWLGAEQGDVSGVIERGYSSGQSAALVAEAMSPRCAPESVAIAQLRDADWTAAIEVELAERDPKHGEVDDRTYLEAQFANYRRLRNEGRGDWYGTFDAQRRLIAGCGLFHDGHSVGRYQSVVTRPEWRRQGVASALVSHVGSWALADGVKKIVIVAKEEATARLYRKLGFASISTPAWTLERCGPNHDADA